MITWCSECDGVHGATRKEPPWKWRCVNVPIPPGFGFVDPTHSPDPPYERCSRVNQVGECEMFTKRREAPQT